MKVLLVGAGVIGTVYGAQLAGELGACRATCASCTGRSSARLLMRSSGSAMQRTPSIFATCWPDASTAGP